MVEKWQFSRSLPNRFFLTAGMMGLPLGAGDSVEENPAIHRPQRADRPEAEPFADGGSIEPRLAATSSRSSNAT
jgi:hypothetical protein